MKNIASFIIKRPLAVIIAIAVITILFAASCLNITLETDIKKLLPKTAVSVKTYEEIDEAFGGADQLYIIIEDDNIFDFDTLSKIRKMSKEIGLVSGVSKVNSITDLNEIRSSPDGIDISPLIDDIPKDKNKLEGFRRKLLTDEKYAGVFVSRDSKATLILATLFIERDKGTVREIDAICSSYEGPEKILISGAPHVASTIMDGMTKDLARITPLVCLLVIMVLAFSFRTWWGVALPLISVLIAAIWAMGFMSLIRQPITVISVSIPALLVSIGSAYGIHFISRYREEDGSHSQQEILETVIRRTGLAIFIAAATTTVGFLSNMVSDISAIRTFGSITAFGIMSSFVITTAFIPSALQFIRRKEKVAEDREKEHQKVLSRILEAVSRFVITKRYWSIAAAAALLAAAFAAYPMLETESDPIRYFNEKSPVVKTSELAKKYFGGAMTLDILVKGDIKDPEVLKRMETLQNRMEKIDILSKPYTIVDALKETNRLLNDDDKRFEVIPETRRGAAQYLLLLSLSGGDFIRTMITSDGEKAKISARCATSSSKLIDEMLKEVKAAVNESFDGDEGTEIYLSGMPVVLKDMREMLISNQVNSLLIAILFVFLMILFFYRNLAGSLFCMIPIVSTVALNFGLMGWLSIPIDIATVMVGSIAIGLGIDYAVHLYNRFKEELENNRSEEDAIRITLTTVGKAVVYNAVAVAMGFFVLPISEFEVLKSFGLLAGFAIVFSALGALALLPDLLLIRRRTK